MSRLIAGYEGPVLADPVSIEEKMPRIYPSPDCPDRVPDSPEPATVYHEAHTRNRIGSVTCLLLNCKLQPKVVKLLPDKNIQAANNLLTLKEFR